MTNKDDDLPQASFKGLLVAFIVGCIVCVGLAEVILRFAMPNWNEFHSGRFMQATKVPDFGTIATGVPNFDGYFAQNNGDFRAHIHINNFGLRNDTPVSTANNKVWFIGDSMTFGWGVERSEMYDSIFTSESGLESYNIASPGTDPCGYQALYARMPSDLKPSAVVVGLILENDMLPETCPEMRGTQSTASEQTSLSVIRIKNFLTGHFALYNFFAVTLKRIDVVRTILTQIGIIKAPQTYRISVDTNTITESATRAADALRDLKRMLPEGTPMVVLIAPGRFEVKDGDKFYHNLRLKIADLLTERGIDNVDPFEGFVAAGFEPTHFAHDGHWAPTGHKIAGEALAIWFKDKGLIQN